MLESRTLSIQVARAADEVYGFARTMPNLPLWASGLGRGIREQDGRWIAETEQGEVEIRFCPENAFGVLDHAVRLPDGGEVQVPLRVIPNQEGAEVLFTLFRQPGMDEEAFRRDAAWIMRDLATLKRLLEA